MDRRDRIELGVLIAVSAIALAYFMVSLLMQLIADGWFSALLAEPWPRRAYRIAYSVAILCGIPTMLVAAYHFLAMTAQVKPERRLLMHLTAPISVFLPQLWTEKGNRHRKLFLLWIATFGLLFAIVVMCSWAVEHRPLIAPPTRGGPA